MTKYRMVREDKFGERLLAAVRRQVAEAGDKLAFRPLGERYQQASFDIEILVTAAKDGGGEAPEPCCVCFKVKAGYICSGDCCADVIEGGVVEPL